jgi:hypothetical protein
MTLTRGQATLAVIVAGISAASAFAYLTGGWQSEPTAASVDPTAAIGPVAGPEDAGPANRLSATAVLSARYQLQGVVAETSAGSTGGVALIAVDGAVARALRVGDAVGSELVLLAVSPAGAILGTPHGTPMMVLDVTPGASNSTARPEDAQATSAARTVALPAADLAMEMHPPAVRPTTGQQQPGRRLRLHHPNPLP